jgi:hypothetical protein
MACIKQDKLVILVVGSELSGKTTLINNITNQLKLQKIDETKRSFFTVSRYLFKDIKKIKIFQDFIKKNYQITHLESGIQSDESNKALFTSKDSCKINSKSKNNISNDKTKSTVEKKKAKTFVESNSKRTTIKDNSFEENFPSKYLKNNDSSKINNKKEDKKQAEKNEKKVKKTKEAELFYNIILEFREIFFEELYSSHRMCNSFFEQANCAYVVANYESNTSFIE